MIVHLAVPDSVIMKRISGEHLSLGGRVGRGTFFTFQGDRGGKGRNTINNHPLSFEIK